MLSSEIRRIINAFGYSLEGIKAAWGDKGAFRTEVVIVFLALPLACLLTHSGAERALLMGSVLLVLMVELLNTGIEDAINRISTDIHPLSKRAKDIGSAAVFVGIVNAFFVWCAVLWN